MTRLAHIMTHFLTSLAHLDLYLPPEEPHRDSLVFCSVTATIAAAPTESVVTETVSLDSAIWTMTYSSSPAHDRYARRLPLGQQPPCWRGGGGGRAVMEGQGAQGDEWVM